MSKKPKARTTYKLPRKVKRGKESKKKERKRTYKFRQMHGKRYVHVAWAPNVGPCEVMCSVFCGFMMNMNAM